MKKKLLLICPTVFDYTELRRESIIADCEIVFYTFENKNLPPILCKGIGKIADHFNPIETLEDILSYCEQEKIEGIISARDYPSAFFSSIIVQEKQFPGTGIESVLLCQHKYESRIKQKELIPQAIPNFTLVDTANFDLHSFTIPFPVFVKPVESSFSILANKAENTAQLFDMLQSCCLPPEYIDQFNWFLSTYSSFGLEKSHVLVEKMLEGVQVTLEGFVFEGRITILGIVDSIMFPGTICFKRFEYPSHLCDTIQQRMATLAMTLVQGINLNNTLFNIEFMYNPVDDSISVIEINPRMTSQFADLFEKVDGINTYEVLIFLAQGKEPILNKRKGQYSIASCFVLRTFEDKFVIAVPTMMNQQKVYESFPDIRFYLFIKPGMKLSDLTQDGKSYRYGLIHLGARDRKELFEKFAACEKMLPFEFGKA